MFAIPLAAMEALMQQRRADMIAVCNQHAADARNIAESTDDLDKQEAFLEMEKRWRSLAQQYERARTVGPRKLYENRSR